MFSPLIVPQYGEWTPVVTAETPGDLSVTYDKQIGRYIKFGKNVIIHCAIDTATFTHSTAAGDLQVTGLPFPAINIAGFKWNGPFVFNNITKAGFTVFIAQVLANTSLIQFNAAGSGASQSKVAITQCPSGGELILEFTVMYETAN